MTHTIQCNASSIDSCVYIMYGEDRYKGRRTAECRPELDM